MKYLLIPPALLCVTIWSFLVALLAFYYSLLEGTDDVIRMLK
jgi:hypothetical protein